MGSANSKPWIWAWLIAELFHTHATGESSPALPQLVQPRLQPARSRAISPVLLSLGRSTCTHTSRASSIVLPRQDASPALLNVAIMNMELALPLGLPKVARARKAISHLPTLPYHMADKLQGQLFHAQALEASLSAPPATIASSTVLYGWGLGALHSLVLQLMKGTASSPVLLLSAPDL